MLIKTKEKIAYISDIVTEYCLYLVIFFIPISKAALEIFFSFAFVAFIFKKILKPNFKFMLNPLHVPLLLFFLFSGISLFNSGPYLLKSFIALFFKWGKYIALFIIVEDTFYNTKRLRNALAVFLASGFIVSIDGVYQNILGLDFIRHKKIVPIARGGYGITASFNHYNDFGAYLLVILSINIGMSLSNKLKIVYKCLFYSLMGLLISCLLLTYSRGSWLGFIFAMFLMLILSRKTRFLIFLLTIFILLLIFLPGVKERNIFTFHPPNSIIWLDADRFQVWQVAFRMIRENPFLGKGLGTFMNYFSKYKPNLYVQYAHNCFLQICAETGIFSLIFFLLFIISVLCKGIKKFKEDNDFILLGLLAGIFGFLVHSFFDTDLYSLQLSFLFWAFMGLISAKLRRIQ